LLSCSVDWLSCLSATSFRVLSICISMTKLMSTWLIP